jgi:hypothetical protein
LPAEINKKWTPPTICPISLAFNNFFFLDLFDLENDMEEEREEKKKKKKRKLLKFDISDYLLLKHGERDMPSKSEEKEAMIQLKGDNGRCGCLEDGSVLLLYTDSNPPQSEMQRPQEDFVYFQSGLKQANDIWPLKSQR